MPTVEGLRKGAEVRLSGVKIGNVKEINFNSKIPDNKEAKDNIELVMEITGKLNGVDDEHRGIGHHQRVVDVSGEVAPEAAHDEDASEQEQVADPVRKRRDGRQQDEDEHAVQVGLDHEPRQPVALRALPGIGRRCQKQRMRGQTKWRDVGQYAVVQQLQVQAQPFHAEA